MNPANVLAVAIPTIAILFGILLNRQDATAIRAELKSVELALRNELRSEIGTLRSELRGEMRSEIGSLRAEMVQLRNSIHADMIGLHERLAVVEAKQAS